MEAEIIRLRHGIPRILLTFFSVAVNGKLLQPSVSPSFHTTTNPPPSPLRRIPLQPSPPSCLLFPPPHPTHTDFVPRWSPWQRRVNFQTCKTWRKSDQQVKKYGDGLRHFIHRTHSVMITYRRFFEARSAYFAICKHKTSCSPITLPQPPSDITAGGNSPWKTSRVLKKNGHNLETDEFTPKTGDQNIQSAASGTKMLMFLLLHRAGSCNFNQSQAEALPMGRVHAQLGRGGRCTKVKNSVLHALPRSRADEAKLHARKQPRLKTILSVKQDPRLLPRYSLRNFQGFEIDWFWAKRLGYNPWGWRWRISLVSAGNLPELP